MEQNGRRQFLKRTAVAAIAAGSLGSASAARAAAARAVEGEKPAARPVLYRETEAWRQYYASLE